MNEHEWRRSLRLALQHMADADYQRRSWTGIGPEVSSFDEVISGVFDDAMLTQYIEQNGPNLSRIVLNVAAELEGAIDVLDMQEFGTRRPDAVIDDPHWITIREIAGRLCVALD